MMGWYGGGVGTGMWHEPTYAAARAMLANTRGPRR
jgi:hypothetical protein